MSNLIFQYLYADMIVVQNFILLMTILLNPTWGKLNIRSLVCSKIA